VPGFRSALKALQFTPSPALYHGVVHLEIRVKMAETPEWTWCEIGRLAGHGGCVLVSRKKQTWLGEYIQMNPNDIS